MYLLDTNTLIYYFKGKGKVAVRLLQVAREVAVSTVTVYELEVGLAKTNASRVRRAQLEDVLAFVTVLPFGIKKPSPRPPYARILNGAAYPSARSTT